MNNNEITLETCSQELEELKRVELLENQQQIHAYEEKLETLEKNVKKLKITGNKDAVEAGRNTKEKMKQDIIDLRKQLEEMETRQHRIARISNEITEIEKKLKDDKITAENTQELNKQLIICQKALEKAKKGATQAELKNLKHISNDLNEVKEELNKKREKLMNDFSEEDENLISEQSASQADKLLGTVIKSAKLDEAGAKLGQYLAAVCGTPKKTGGIGGKFFRLFSGIKQKLFGAKGFKGMRQAADLFIHKKIGTATFLTRLYKSRTNLKGNEESEALGKAGIFDKALLNVWLLYADNCIDKTIDKLKGQKIPGKEGNKELESKDLSNSLWLWEKDYTAQTLPTIQKDYKSWENTLAKKLKLDVPAWTAPHIKVNKKRLIDAKDDADEVLLLNINSALKID